MRIKVKQSDGDLCKWQDWFAWHPVIVSSYEGKFIVWLQKVVRLRAQNWKDDYYWRYSFIEKLDNI